jgi:prophage tail gpP-like protein
MLQLRINGTVYSGFTTARATKTMAALCGSFEFSTSGGDNITLITQDIKLFDLVEIYADEVKIMTGYVEVLDVSYSADSYSVVISGREKTCDVVDTRISTSFVNTETKTYLDLITQAFKVAGFSIPSTNVINVVDNSTTATNAFSRTDFQISGDGQSLYDFLNLYAQKQFIVLTTDENGDIVLTNSGSEISGYDIINFKGVDVKNNIYKATVNYNVSQLFNTYQYRCNPNFVDVFDQGATSAEQSTIVYTSQADDSVRVGRTYIDIDNEIYTLAKLKDRVAWKMQTAQANARKYSVTLNGHTFEQKLEPTNINSFLDTPSLVKPLKINQLINVNDQICGIDEIMLIETLVYSMNESGNTLDITLVNRNAYTLQIEDTILSNKFYGTGNV